MYISLFVTNLLLTSQLITLANGNENHNNKNHNQGNLLRMPIMKKPIPPSKYLKNHHHNQQKRDGSSFKGGLYNDQGSQYLITVGVGTPPQEFLVTFDTGSADLWIPSSECDTNSCPFGGFDSSRSSTFTKSDEAFSIQYGIGAVNGTYVKDTVTISGASVQNQQLGLAYETKDILIPSPTQEGQPPSNMNANGILGLGYPLLTAGANNNDNIYTPFVFNLIQQNIIQEPLFSVYLNQASKNGWVGEVIFGGIDSTKFTGDLVYVPVAKLEVPSSTKEEDNGSSSNNNKKAMKQMFSGVQKEEGDNHDDMKIIDAALSDDFLQRIRHNRYTNKNMNIPPYKSTDASSSTNYDGYYYWMVYGYGISINNAIQSLHFKLRRAGGAFILDTGTTLTYLPNDVAISIAKSIAGSQGQGRIMMDRQSGLLLVDCGLAQSKATLSLQMATDPSMSGPPVNFTIKSSELVIPIDTESVTTATQCLFGIAPVGNTSGGGLGHNLFLIGDSMLRSAYLVFDFGRHRVGIAAAKGMGSSVHGENATSYPMNDPNNAWSVSMSSTAPFLEIYVSLLILVSTCLIQLY